MYYLRTKPAASAIQFTVDKAALKETGKAEEGENNTNMDAMVCSLENPDSCTMCGS